MNVGAIPAKQARLTPGREAVIDATSGRRVTFGQLDARVRRLGAGLRGELGMVPGDRVAVLSKNSIEYLETYFAAGQRRLFGQDNGSVVGRLIRNTAGIRPFDLGQRLFDPAAPILRAFLESFAKFRHRGLACRAHPAQHDHRSHGGAAGTGTESLQQCGHGRLADGL